MTPTEHTPGPWKVYLSEDGMMIGIGVDRPDSKDHGAGVTDPYFGLWGDGAERNANARLIAAAPDLLAAVALFLAYDAKDGLAFKSYRDALAAAKAAYAKATGGAA